MRWCIGAVVSCISLFSFSAAAQFPITPTPTPRPGSRQASLPGPAADSVNYDRLRSIELMTPRSGLINHPLLDPKKGIYRKPGKDEVEVLAVSDQLLLKHASFLKGGNTGIVKLNAEASCISDEDVVIASEKCLPFKMPGAGTAFSFRLESYRLPRLADIILIDGIFRTGGVLQQVIMVDLGSAPIEDITLTSRGLKYLVDLKPAEDGDGFLRFDTENTKGVQNDGFLYRKGHRVRPDTTYALRSIAYRGNYVRSIDGISYDELEFDKRRDVIVAFRVVEQDAAGNITILWKRLKDVEAPKLKVKK